MEIIIKSNFETAGSRDKIALECNYCHCIFYKPKNKIQTNLKHKISDKHYHYNYKFCSNQCRGFANGKLKIVFCKTCNKRFIRQISQFEGKGLGFCSCSCAGIYGASHRMTKNRSKLEVWIQENLTKLYPKLKILYNDRSVLESLELDIYIPSLKLAFELNGIFHYEEIFTKKKLDKVQNNDNRKFQQCIKKEISLCVINTSKQKYFKEKTCIPYLEIITNIINSRNSLA